MTIREVINSAGQELPMSILFLLITLQMALILAAFRDGRSRRMKCVLLIHFLLSAAVFWVCMSFISWDNNNPDGTKTLYGWLAAVGSFPVLSVAVYEAVTAGILAFVAGETFSYRKSHPTRDSIKETMDLLPVGVAYGRADGTVLFRNLVMDHLSQELTGKLMTDLAAFRTAAGGAENQGQITSQGRVWQTDTRQMASDGDPLLQLTAADITEQAGIVADLESNNKKLKDIHLRLEIYNRQAERIIIAQELLTARMTVHNELGQVLLESRHCLNDPSSIDEELLLQALKNTNTYLLREYEKDDTDVDPLAEAIGMAGAVGVKAVLTGIPPAEGSPRLILAAAIRECATNTAKHAEGDRLAVDVRHTDDTYTFTLRSNGTPPGDGTHPGDPVRESGGLASLRKLVENAKGSMRTDSGPEFTVTVSVPQEDPRTKQPISRTD
ncbi:MAG: hypothetical protein IKG23_09565 [Clostridia bacterium]|nr:hypothetical protein [Clostridia bacterium]